MALAAAAAVASAVMNNFHAFRRQLSHYCNVTLYDSRDEVRYRLGYPPFVIDEPKDGWAQVYNTDSTADPKNAIPPGKDINGFSEWSYPQDPQAPNGVNVDVTFGKDGRLAQIDCNDGTHISAKTCPPLLGIAIGTSEEEVVRKLGEPSRSAIEGVSKHIRYDDLGVEFLLTKGAVYSLKITSHKPDDLRLFRRFISQAGH